MSILSKSPDGTIWYSYLDGSIRTVKNPGNGVIIDTTYESPVFFSTPSRLFARRWTVTNAGIPVLKTATLQEAHVDYIEMLTPARVSYVLGIDDADQVYLELFTEIGHGKRIIVPTVMHKGNMVWVADNRLGIPGRS